MLRSSKLLVLSEGRMRRARADEGASDRGDGPGSTGSTASRLMVTKELRAQQ